MLPLFFSLVFYSSIFVLFSFAFNTYLFIIFSFNVFCSVFYSFIFYKILFMLLYFFLLIYFSLCSFGRRFVYYISVIFCSIGRLSSIVTTFHYTWFLIFSGLTALTINSLFQSPQIIGMEISRE